MDELLAEFIKRLLLKIPISEIMTILRTWGFLSESQLQTITLRQRKELLAQDVVQLCEESGVSLDDVALLDIIYNQVHRHQKLWDVFKMSKGAGEDVDLFDIEQFKSSFTKILRKALKNVMVSFREAEEKALWIRIAWGTQRTMPNQYKATYVVYYPQTPYVFVSSSRMKSSIPLLGQALVIATKHHQIIKKDFRSRYLDSLVSIVFKQYNQAFETHNSPAPVQEISPWQDTDEDVRIVHEHTVEKERIQRVTQQVFGDYPQPRLEFAQYQLETRFQSNLNRSILAERKEPLRCLIKFSSPHLLEALKSLAPAGIADAPLSPLLSCIPKKGMNYFKIRDK
ncbi:PREDICTED: centromere protein N isoform X1 [Elephantulus edwardii]|uniref:centromere protein N isoform X1 n=1 Tax=Elephantulus edwardii TaxID=28737 RepID=UPI0003F0A952|nr:PREDICTED: centromere protein N isoform X1 [Elephantulus edwardii]